jgi:hypothetical protein
LFNHSSLSAIINGSGETALVLMSFNILAFFNSLSSQVQKESAFAASAQAKCRASSGLMPIAFKAFARFSMSSVNPMKIHQGKAARYPNCHLTNPDKRNYRIWLFKVARLSTRHNFWVCLCYYR